MFEILRDYYENCTKDGMIDKCGFLGKFLNTLYFLFTFILIGIFSVILYIGLSFFINFSELLTKGDFSTSILFWLFVIFSMFLIFYISFQISLRAYQALSLKLLKKKYHHQLHKANIYYFKAKNFKERLYYPLHTNNEYRAIIKYLKKISVKNFEKRNKINKEHVELIDELIHINNQQLRTLNEQSTSKSNKVMYAFLGGIIINKVFDLIFNILTSIANSKIGLTNLILFLLLMIMIITYLCIQSNKIYEWTYLKFWNNHTTKQILKIEEFNQYLIDKKIKILQNI